MSPIKLSIIVPIFNAEKYIEKCIESMLIETDETVEIILVEDCSTDKSLAICKKLHCKDSRIKLILNEINSGVSFSRSQGIDSAQGTFIMFVDADDYLIEGWYSRVCKVLNSQSNIDYVIFSSSVNVMIRRTELFYALLGMKKQCNISGVYSKLFRKQFLLDNNLTIMPDVVHGEDMLFNLSVFMKTKNIYIENESIYIYRLNTSSATHTFNPKIIESDKKFHSILDELLTSNEIVDREDVLKKTLARAIYILLMRISYIEDNKEKYNYIRFIEEFPYCSISLQDIHFQKGMSFPQKLLLYLLKGRFYQVVIMILSIRQFIKKIYRGKLTKEQYTEY